MKLFFWVLPCIVTSMDSGSAPEGADEDIRLIRSVLKGNTSDYRYLVEKYWNPIFRYASTFLASREEAEEAVQDIFVRGYRYLGSFRIGQDFLPWIFGIASNRLRERYGRIKRLQKGLEKYRRYAADDLPEYRDPETEVLEEQDRIEIRRAVEKLPVSLRDSVYLYYFEEMDIEGIAAALGLSRENVKSRLHRGRKKLRLFLEKMQPKRNGGGIGG